MEILRKLRESRGLTLEQVAEALGSKNQYISNYELGKRRPDYEMLSRFADFYGVSVDFLLGRGTQEIMLDSFTYAMQNETKELEESDKAVLLSLARQLKSARKQKNGQTDPTI